MKQTKSKTNRRNVEVPKCSSIGWNMQALQTKHSQAKHRQALQTKHSQAKHRQAKHSQAGRYL